MSRKSRMNEEPFDVKAFWEEMDRTVLAEYHNQDFYLNNRSISKPKEPTLEELDKKIAAAEAYADKAHEKMRAFMAGVAEYMKERPNMHVTPPGYTEYRSAMEEARKLKAKREQLLKTQK